MFVALGRLERSDEALVHARQGLQCAQAAGDRNTEGAIHNNIGLTQLKAHTDLLGKHAFQRAMVAYNAAGSRHGAITVQSNLAVCEHELGNFVTARDMHLRNLLACQDIGHRAMEAHTCANLSFTLFELGEFCAAEERALQALQLAQLAGERWAQAYAHAGVYLSASAQARWPQALEHAWAARDAFAKLRDQIEVWSFCSAAASALHAMGDRTAAMAEAEAVLADVAAQGGWRDCIEGPMRLYRVLAPQGDRRAPELLATASQNLEALAEHFSAMLSREHFLRATAARRELGDALAAARAA